MAAAIVERPGEQRHEQPGLGYRGVLVLVEEHDLELLALGAPDLATLLGKLRAERHLVGEVHHPKLGA